MYARIPAPSDLYGESGSNKSDEDTTCAEAKSEKTGTTAESCLRIEDRQSKPKNISQHLWEFQNECMMNCLQFSSEYGMCLGFGAVDTDPEPAVLMIGFFDPSVCIWAQLSQKFKVLQKRTDDATRRSTEKRIKHLQKETLAKVQEEITNPDDIDILREHDVRLGPPVIRNPEKTPSGQKRKNEDKPSDAPSTSTSNAEWLEVRDLLTVNDHLKGVDRGKHAPKTQLEKNVDAAIAGGDLEEAEELSDRLATREFGKKIADAIDARNYLRDKQKEAETDKAKKKRKLNWGFEHKQRWETKGNM